MGIAYVYVLNSERDVRKDGDSPILELIDLLKMKMVKKKELVFCVLTKWDKVVLMPYK